MYIYKYNYIYIYIHICNFEYSRGRECQCISQRTDFGWHKSSDDSKYQRKIGKTACLKNHMPENLEMEQTYFFYWGLFPQWFLRTWWLSNGTVFNHPIQCQDSVVLLKAHQLTNHWRVPPFFRRVFHLKKFHLKKTHTHPKLPASSVKVHVLQGSNLGCHSSSQLWMGYSGIC